MRHFRIQTVEKYRALAGKNHRWTESEIRAVTKLINSKRFGGTPEELKLAIGSLEASFGVYNITKEQSQKGIEYLRRRYFKLNGEPRKSSPFGYRENTIIKNFKKFTFEGLYTEYNNYGIGWSMPIYRVHAKNGDTFAYCPIHWGDPIIVG